MNRFLKELLKSILVGTVLYLVFMAVYYFSGVYDSGFDFAELIIDFYEHMVFAIILYMANAYWFLYLIRKYGYNVYELKRFVFALSGNLILSLVGVFIARCIVIVFLQGQHFELFLMNERITYYRSSMLIALGVALIFYALWYYKYRQESRVKEQKIIAGTASARFDALKNQLDPHFLFNSLNVLTSLIEEDQFQAQKFTTSLSKVYRYVLEQKNKDLVTVDEELNFARTYVRLLKMRFEDSIIFEIPDQCSIPDAKIVPLSLQLLLENAVKHNIVTSSKPLRIKVYEEKGMLVVENNLQEKQVIKKSSGVGLQNIQQRYTILSDRRVYINKTASSFSVALPMLTQQISWQETQEVHIEEKRYLKAKERVEILKGFYSNLIAYCIVIPFLWWLNFRTTDFLWAFFPTIGWGFGVIAHGLEASGRNPLWGRRWEERKIQELMEKDDF